VIVAHVITGLNDGGAQTMLYRLCAADPSHRHVVITLMDIGQYGALLERSGVTVHCLNMPSGRVTAGGVRHLWRLLRHYKPDVVQTWLYHADLLGGVVARLAGIRRVHWGVRSGKLLWIAGQRLTMVLRLCNAPLSWFVPQTIICNSSRAAEVHRAIGYRAARITVIPNGVDADTFRPSASLRESLRREWQVPSGMTLIGAVGRYDPYKGHGDLIAALSLLRSSGKTFRCVLAGEGVAAHNQALVEQLDRAGLSQCVLLVGRRADIPAIMNALDVLVLSSVAEAFPCVLIEAMACGVPCVATDVGDVKAILGDTGWVVPPRDPQGLAHGLGLALMALEGNGDTLARRKSACRARVVERFTIGRMVNAFHAVWQPSLCESPS